MFKKRKPSFFEKLTGSVRIDDAEDFDLDEFEDEYDEDTPLRNVHEQTPSPEDNFPVHNEPSADGELTVDVIETQDSIIVKAMVAGVDPDSIDIDLSRDTVTIKGERKESHSFTDDEYHHKELYWGAFSRTIVLPAEIEVEEASAKSDHGLLIVTLPKIDKHRKTKLRISKK